MEPIKNPIIGLLSLSKGTDRGTITDFDGNFELNASKDEIFVVSYIGYKSQEVLITSDKFYEISLETESVLLDQVVVVGYGSQRKVDITGSTVSVKGEDLAKQPVMTATQVLGKVAGVQIISVANPDLLQMCVLEERERL